MIQDNPEILEKYFPSTSCLQKGVLLGREITQCKFPSKAATFLYSLLFNISFFLLENSFNKFLSVSIFSLISSLFLSSFIHLSELNNQIHTIIIFTLTSYFSPISMTHHHLKNLLSPFAPILSFSMPQTFLENVF